MSGSLSNLPWISVEENEPRAVNTAILSWLLLIKLSLAFEEARKTPLGAHLLQLRYDEFADEATAETDLKYAAKAYNIVRQIVQDTTPENGSTLRCAWRDVVVGFCAKLSGVSVCDTFMQKMDEAFNGELCAANLNLSSQLLHAYHRIFCKTHGAFHSKTCALAKKRGGPRRARNGRGRRQQQEETPNIGAGTVSFPILREGECAKLMYNAVEDLLIWGL